MAGKIKGQEFTDFCLSGMSFSFPNIAIASSGTSGNCPVGPEIAVNPEQRFAFFLFGSMG